VDSVPEALLNRVFSNCDGVFRQPDQASWSLKQLFGMGASPACPLAATSMIFIDTTGSVHF